MGETQVGWDAASVMARKREGERSEKSANVLQDPHLSHELTMRRMLDRTRVADIASEFGSIALTARDLSMQVKATRGPSAMPMDPAAIPTKTTVGEKRPPSFHLR